MTTQTLSPAFGTARLGPQSGIFRRLLARFAAATVLLAIYGLGAVGVTVGVSGLTLTAAGISSTPARAQGRRRRRRRGRRRRGDRWRGDRRCWEILTPLGWICL
jgi:hypothetical protein